MWRCCATCGSDNILFGRPYDPAAFAQTLEACCMLEDVASMSNGDQTLVGASSEVGEGVGRAEGGVMRELT